MEYKVMTIDMDCYPNHLRNIDNPPRKLYYIGNIDLIQAPCIAVVGTRRASPYGRWVAFEISKKIAAAGIPVVSGMASGIDTQAHIGCLDKGIGTVAVLGTGVDVVYPKSNNNLYEKITKNGLVLSEYEPGSNGEAWHFPERNRIISGLSEKVIVVEGAYKSGSMITARLALDQGRDVYAVPGNINQPGSIGVNSLIADGAFPIISLDNLYDTLGISNYQIEMQFSKLNTEEQLFYNVILQNPGICSDEISVKVNKSASSVLKTLSCLELKTIIRKEGNRYWTVSSH